MNTNTVLVELFDEVRLLFHSLTAVSDRLHKGDDIAAGQRAVLEMVAEGGPLTVPSMARRRRVTRQFVQALVDGLLARGLVKMLPNPEHKRSRLVSLTEAGEGMWRRIGQRELKLLVRVGQDLNARSIASTAGRLRDIRRRLGEEK